jgi:hypothetical protein
MSDAGVNRPGALIALQLLIVHVPENVPTLRDNWAIVKSGFES